MNARFFRLASCALASAMALVPVSADARRKPAVVITTTNDASFVLSAINAERRSARVGFVALDIRLCSIAQQYANDMARRNYFGHVSPEGLDPFARMRRAGYRFRTAGENIGLNAGIARTHAALWLDPPHRANILMPAFGHVGIGTARYRGSTLVVEDFSD